MVGIGRGAQEGILLRGAEALQHLEKVTHLVCDKTGTLTEGRPRVVDLFEVTEEVLRDIACPSLLVYGSHSNFYHSATAHYVAGQIRDSVLKIYEGCDHSPHQWQRERFVRDLLDFIAA